MSFFLGARFAARCLRGNRPFRLTKNTCRIPIKYFIGLDKQSSYEQSGHLSEGTGLGSQRHLGPISQYCNFPGCKSLARQSRDNVFLVGIMFV